MEKDKEKQKRQQEELMKKVYIELMQISGEVEELNKIRLNGFNKMDINIAELENSLNRGFKMVAEKQMKIEEKNEEVKESLNKIAKNLGDVEH
ncbi:hypothetical protein COL23_11490 [Priestia aryabhattai]|uniref:hypothetical protein n=1 Tax=Priestia aryabhattai TaxID=412384 RepID=UPI000BF75C51|nr:hypothetical protein [Priestia aryabhattai]PFW76585.1 hypothetical protein COL23_11490 [Priestia aryabhattai]